MDSKNEDVCPISHIPLSQIKHPVVIIKSTTNLSIVYDAEHIVQWLKHHSLLDPITNKKIPAGFANSILRPASSSATTAAFLARAGYLNGRGGTVRRRCLFKSFVWTIFLHFIGTFMVSTSLVVKICLGPSHSLTY